MTAYCAYTKCSTYNPTSSNHPGSPSLSGTHNTCFSSGVLPLNVGHKPRSSSRHAHGQGHGHKSHSSSGNRIQVSNAGYDATRSDEVVSKYQSGHHHRLHQDYASTTSTCTSSPSPYHHHSTSTPTSNEKIIQNIYQRLLPHLSSCLRTLNGIRNLPGGFPFRYILDSSSGISLCHDAYEFQEYLPIPIHTVVPGYGTQTQSQLQAVTFSFRPPSSSRRGSTRTSTNTSSISTSSYFSWKITIDRTDPRMRSPSANDNFYFLNHPQHRPSSSSKLTLAEVLVDPSVFSGTRYGKHIRKDPKVVLNTLATSLEESKLVIICLGDSSLVSRALQKGRKVERGGGSLEGTEYGRDTVVYVGRGSDGKDEMLYKTSAM
ncbi:hypothetical protein K435DRAFT_405996 [Dendrothele bispora CBS 962.96]|uniref:Uncharacterized protein n=1 Tax=Dendrothele bispora (strain CBS 962.96) TaxID=1314807 RepID=A0A4V4HCR3_DENBC|nr:hypothetical protein K435DRAFT_405996 [Dendrothele bispora CBS 962.96]